MAMSVQRLFRPVESTTLFEHRVSKDIRTLSEWLSYAAPLGPIGARALVESYLQSGVLTRCEGSIYVCHL